jgi:cytosine deaminase
MKPAIPPDTFVIRKVRPIGGAPADSPTDILVEGGVIKGIGVDLPVPAGTRAIEGRGRLALPGLINAHCHLDKTRFGLPWWPHAAGPERDSRIAVDRGVRPDLMPSTAERARRLCERMAELGTTHIRSHVDVEPEFGLAAVEALLEMRAGLRGGPRVELVAFPQFGLLTNPGTAALLEAACRAGAECVGGIDPSVIDGDAAGHLDTVFAIAERTGAGIDIHLHESGEVGAASLAMICERTRALSMAGRVAVSHAFCLGTLADARAGALIDAMAAAGVAVVTYAPGNSPVPDLRRMRAAGVTVALGTDGIRDVWTPYGDGDMLERAMMLAYRLGYRRDEDIELALDAAITGGAKVMGVADHGLAVGCAGRILLVDAETPAEAVCVRPASVQAVGFLPVNSISPPGNK